LPYFHVGRLHFADSRQHDVARALRLPSSGLAERPPSAEEIVEAAHAHRRMLDAAADPDGGSPESLPSAVAEFSPGREDETIRPAGRGDAPSTAVPAPGGFGGRLLQTREQRFFLLVRVLLEGSPDGQFEICCPFGLPIGLRWVRLLHFASANQG